MYQANTPDKKELKTFGIVTGLLIILLVGTLIPWLWDQDILEWQKYTGSIGGALILWGFVHSESLIWVYKPWMLFAEKVGWFNTRLILFLLFFMLFMPLGIIMRTFGYDPMTRKFDQTAKSYRKDKEPQTKDHMATPY